MDTIYRVLKILIALLAAAVILVGALVLRDNAAGKPAEEAEAPALQETAQAQEKDMAPDFTMYDAEGNGYRLSDFRGKPVILNFWASWCGPCKAEMPDFEAAYQEYGDEIQFLMVNLTDGTSETVGVASGYIAGQGYTFPVYYDTAMEGSTAYSIYAIPVSHFIDAEGALVSSHTGMMTADALQEEIEMLLAR